MNPPAAPESTRPEPHPPRRGHAPRSAAGLGAIWHSLKIGLSRSGFLRTMRLYLRVNQRDGFDCQSCAWPNPDGKRHFFEFCENGAKAMASEATSSTIGREFFRRHSIAALQQKSDYWLDLQGRLAEPMVRRPGSEHYEAISWEDAFGLIGDKLRGLPSPNEAVFYTSGRASNEAAFAYQLFARLFGTNNLPDCSNMCHESTGTALAAALGLGKGSVTIEDVEDTDLILIMGHNPGTNHPRMMTSLEHARKKGARIVAINPLRETGLFRVRNPNPQEYSNPVSFVARQFSSGTVLADTFLQVRIGGDLPLVKALCRVVFEEEDAKPGKVLDREFIERFTIGFAALEADIRGGDFADWCRLAGVAEADVRQVGRMIAGARRMIICWCMGLTQHVNAVDTIRAVVNLLLLGGHMGRPGAGACPVRGHSNVQGDRTMGVWEKIKPEFAAKLETEFGFSPPRDDGFAAVDAITALHEGRARVLVGLGGNLLQAIADTHYTAEAYRRADLTVQISTKLNRSHLVTGETALILPCVGRSEVDQPGNRPQFVTVEDSMGVVSKSEGRLPPVSHHLKSEVAIICGIAGRAVGNARVPWNEWAVDYDLIRDRISRVVPGCEDMNARIRRGPFYLPNGPRERTFATKSGRAEFHVAPIRMPAVAQDEFLLATIRSHDQFNTTVYGLDDRYRGIFGGRRVVFLNPEDIRERGWQQGLFVDLVNRTGGRERRAPRFMIAPYDIPRGCAAAYFPEANEVVPHGMVADGSLQPASKSVAIALEVSDDQAAAARAHGRS